MFLITVIKHELDPYLVPSTVTVIQKIVDMVFRIIFMTTRIVVSIVHKVYEGIRK